MIQSLRHALLMLLLLGMASTAQAQTLALRTDLWCPYGCDPAAASQGFFVDVVRAALPQAQIDYARGRWTELRSQRSAPPGPALLLLGISRTERNRKELVFVSPPLGQARTCAYRRMDHDWWLRDPSSLRGQRLSLTQGYSYGDEVASLLANPQTRRLITQLGSERAPTSHARMLSLGRTDVALEERQVMRWTLEKEGLQGIVEAGCLPPRDTDALYLALPQSDPRAGELAKALEQGLQRMVQSGEMARLRARYGLGP